MTVSHTSWDAYETGGGQSQAMLIHYHMLSLGETAAVSQDGWEKIPLTGAPIIGSPSPGYSTIACNGDTSAASRYLLAVSGSHVVEAPTITTVSTEYGSYSSWSGGYSEQHVIFANNGGNFAWLSRDSALNNFAYPWPDSLSLPSWAVGADQPTHWFPKNAALNWMTSGSTFAKWAWTNCGLVRARAPIGSERSLITPIRDGRFSSFAAGPASSRYSAAMKAAALGSHWLFQDESGNRFTAAWPHYGSDLDASGTFQWYGYASPGYWDDAYGTANQVSLGVYIYWRDPAGVVLATGFAWCAIDIDANGMASGTLTYDLNATRPARATWMAIRFDAWTRGGSPSPSAWVAGHTGIGARIPIALPPCASLGGVPESVAIPGIILPTT